MARNVREGYASTVNLADWPTCTLLMSASFTWAVILNELLSTSVMNADDVLVELDEEDVEELEPEPTLWPTLPLIAATVAFAGAVNVAAARLSWAVFS